VLYLNIPGIDRSAQQMKIRHWGSGITVALVLCGSLFAGPASSAAEPIVPGHLPYPAGGTSVLGDGIDAGNRNAQLAETVPAQINQSWRAEPPLCPSSGGSSAVSISVSGNRTVVVDTQYQCSWLSAYETGTGKLLWRHQYHFAHMAKIDGSRVYLAHDNPETSQMVLDTFNLNTGALLWTSPYVSEYRTVFGSGVVMGGYYALDATTGINRFVAGPSATSEPSLIEAGRVIYNGQGLVEAFSATTGKSIWKYVKPGGNSGPYGPGAGTAAASVHNGRLYIPSNFYTAQTLVLDAATGRYIRTLPNSTKAIAFDGRTGIFTTSGYSEPSVITAVDLETGAVQWTHRLGMKDLNYGYEVVSSAPVIANGLVWILAGVDTGTPGQLMALDEITGRIRSGTTVGCPPAFGGNLAIAQHRIFVPTACGVQTYVPGAADTVAPTVTGRTPAASATNMSQTGDITVGFSEVVSGVNGSTFTLKNPAGTVIPATVTYNETIRVATLNPTGALAADTKYTVTLTGSVTAIRDASNNALATTQWTFTTGPGPTVTNRTAWFATGVSQTADVTATFSEPVIGVSATTFTLKNPAGTAVPATVTYNPTSRVATLNPTTTLAADTRYTATLTGSATAIRDVAGNPLADNPSEKEPSATTSWYFTTGPVPTVISRSPAVNATAVSRTADITATFSEPVTGTSGNYFMLTNATTGAMVPVELYSYNAASRVATLNPRGTLTANTKYTVTLTSSTYGGIRDAAGNPLQTTRWTFTTGP